MQELAVQAAWLDGAYEARDLRTTDGRTLRVLSPGHAVGGPGPDFRHARLLLDEEPLEGDVEVHVRGGDWRVHGHHRDPAYRTVVLHVFVEDEEPMPPGVAQVCLGDRLRIGAETRDDPLLARAAFAEAAARTAGRCLELRVGPVCREGRLRRCLESLGMDRLTEKARRFHEPDADREEVFYRLLWRTVGYGTYPNRFEDLGARLPLTAADLILERVEPEDRASALEWACLRALGLRGDLPAPWGPRIAQLAPLGIELAGLPLPAPAEVPPPGCGRGARRAAHPAARVAGWAAFLAAVRPSSLLDAPMRLLAAVGRAEVSPAEGLDALEDAFRFPVTDAISVGAERAHLMVINAVLPAGLADPDPVRREGALRLALVPSGREEHAPITFVLRRLTGAGRRPLRFPLVPAARQGLLAVHGAACRMGAAGCGPCPLRAALVSTTAPPGA